MSLPIRLAGGGGGDEWMNQAQVQHSFDCPVCPTCPEPTLEAAGWTPGILDGPLQFFRGITVWSDVVFLLALLFCFILAFCLIPPLRRPIVWVIEIVKKAWKMGEQKDKKAKK